MERQSTSARTSGEYGALQRELNAALFHLGRARCEKASGSIAGVMSVLGSLLGVLTGLGLIGLSRWAPVFGAVGVPVTVGAMLGFYEAFHVLAMRPPSLERATRRLIQLGDRLTGIEELCIDASGRAQLHGLLLDAEPDLVAAILKTLSICGDEESLWYARSLSGFSANGSLFAAGRDARVRMAATETVNRLLDRLEVARRSRTLLRPIEPSPEGQLLRVVTGETVDPSRLLRSAEPEGEGGSTRAA